MKPPYQYAAEGVRAVDGDTIDVILDFGFSLKQKLRLRLSGINTPELNSKDESERTKAVEARDYVHNVLFYDAGVRRALIVRTIKTKAGKERQTFGRYVAEVYYQKGEDWVHLNQELVDLGLAKESRW
jgi:micrococcal nuclease